MKNIKDFLKKNLITIIGLPVGALGGFLYWHYIGCNSGACPITGDPLISSIYGAILGALLFSSFKSKS